MTGRVEEFGRLIRLLACRVVWHPGRRRVSGRKALRSREKHRYLQNLRSLLSDQATVVSSALPSRVGIRAPHPPYRQRFLEKQRVNTEVLQHKGFKSGGGRRDPQQAASLCSVHVLEQRKLLTEVMMSRHESDRLAYWKLRNEASELGAMINEIRRSGEGGAAGMKMASCKSHQTKTKSRA